ncbi:MAG: HIT family protein [Bacteroidales bacterium]|nr:HIT family protein [Bacteroidales bacterium]
MINNSCPFCGDIIKNFAFLESRNFMAIYNRAPILPGHSLVIPKKHVISLFELEQSERAELMEFSMITVELLQKAFKAKAFDWTIQEGVAAGQTVNHLHLHIIPRKEKDLANPGDWYPLIAQNESDIYVDSELRPKLSIDELKSVVDMIKSYLD